MTRSYEHRQFEDIRNRALSRVISDIECHDCHFKSCHLWATDDPALRSTVRGVELHDCSQLACYVDRVIFEDVLVDGLKNVGGMLQIYGAVFNRVVLRGKIHRLMISSFVELTEDNPEMQKAFDEANAKYYRKVKWALDISKGEFSELDLRGVPGRLVRRDPETQILVTRKKALEGSWRGLPWKDGLWEFVLDLFLQENTPDIVLVAGKRSQKFKALQADLKLLRKAGVAEPD